MSLPGADRKGGISETFLHIARVASAWVGSPWAFVGATAAVLIWGITGPLFHFSETWQLVINTGTTIVTFLMVFLVQSSQNRDAMAMQLKLDEIIKCLEPARNTLVKLENASDERIRELSEEFETVAANSELEQPVPPTGSS